MFQKRVQAWNITNDEGDQASDEKVMKGQSAFEYDDIDDSDTEDVFEL